MDINIGDTVEVLSDYPHASYFLKGDTFTVLAVNADILYGKKEGQEFRNCVLTKHVRKIVDDVIRVGDTVERIVDCTDNTDDHYKKKGWRGVVTYVSDDVIGFGFSKNSKRDSALRYYKKVRPYDDTIRVGDTVMTPTVKGVEYVVLSFDDPDHITVKVSKSTLGSTGHHYIHQRLSLFKKIKSGSDSTPATNTQQSDEVRGESQGEGHGCGQGKAVAAHGRHGQVANAGRLAGNAVAPRVGAGGVRGAQVLFTALRPEAQ